MTSLSDQVSLVQRIAAEGFKDAASVWKCLELLDNGALPTTIRKLDQAGATPAATFIRETFYLRILITVERAFDRPDSRHKDDRNTRVAFKLLEDQAVFDAAAALGIRRRLEQAMETWEGLDAGRRRKQLREFRNKVVVHQAKPNPEIAAPALHDLRALASSLVHLWTLLAYGAGVEADGSFRSQLEPIKASSVAFWKPWWGEPFKQIS